MKKMNKLLLIIFMLLPFHHLVAMAEPTTAIVGTVTTAVTLNNIKEMLTSSVDQAAERLDYSVAIAGLQVLEAIETWEKTNSNLLDIAFNKLDSSAQDVFSNINSSLLKANGVAASNIKEVQEITLSLNQISESTIISENRSYILRQNPLVSPVDNNEVVTLRLSGVNLDKADPYIEIKGKKAERRLLGSTKVEFDIPKSELESTNSKIALTTFTLKHTTRDGSYFFFIPKYKDVERQLTLATLPNFIGKYEIKINRAIKGREVKNYAGDGGKFKGTNKTIKKVIKPKQGWKWLVDNREEFKVTTTGKGESAKCHKTPVWNDSTQNGVVISARVDKIRKTTKWGDAYISCGLKGPIYKNIITNQIQYIKNRTLDWKSDRSETLPADTKSFEIRFTTFNGTTHIINNTFNNSKFFDVIKSGKTIIIRPKVVTDFI